jgi:uncharacterized secreted protein with C-terminal beta-propeller domain
MQRFLSASLLLTILALSVGCPFGPRNRTYQYTSADLQGGGDLRDDVLAGIEEGGGAPSPVVERAVVEPDVIRQDGDTLYILNQYRGLSIVGLADHEIVAQVSTYGFPRDLYVVGDRAYVLVAYATRYDIEGNTVSYTIGSRVYVVDLEDPESAAIIGSFDLDGDLIDSRLVGDVLYAISAEFSWVWDGVVVSRAKTSGTRVTSINVANPGSIFVADEVELDGYGDEIHATNFALFVSAPQWESGGTMITYIDISDPGGQISVRDAVTVPGYVADRFKMDAYAGVLRVVSSAWFEERQVIITTVDLADPDHLRILAQTEFERARGDSLFATRFDGPRGYIVTYFVVDPLFVLDLSNPLDPQVIGELEVPGWSTHIEPRGDRLVTLGVDDTEGRRVSVSLFNVSDPANPSLIERVSFGGNWNWSPAYDDVKAFSVLDDTIIVPFSGWEEGDVGSFDRLQFVSWNPDDLDKRGALDMQGAVIRSFAYGDSFYAVTTEQLAVIDGSDLDDPEITDRVTLAENVADFLELSPQVGVEIVSQYTTGLTTARAVGLPLKDALGHVDVQIGDLVAAHRRGDSVVLVGARYWDDPGYRVAVIDFAEPSNPIVLDVIEVNVTPHYGWWWILPVGIGGGGAEPGVAVDSVIWPWFPSFRQDSTLLAGDALALRCIADSFDYTIGDGPAYEGLALVDLDAITWTDTVGLGFEAVSSVDVIGNKLYIGSKTFLDPIFTDPGPMCAHFVTEFDPAAGDAGPSVNVPGAFVRYDPAAGILTLRDDQWGANFTSNSHLRTVSWHGGAEIDEIDNVLLPTGTSLTLGRGQRVYLDVYDEGSRLYVARIGPDGNILLGSGVLVTDQWAGLIDAHGASAFVNVGSGAIARYSFAGQPALEELVEVMAIPHRIRFGESRAYAPLGYAGIVELNL